MGGSFSVAATRGCRATHTLITAALALVALAVPFAGTAAAQPAASKVDTADITMPAGVVVTPDGETWISDEIYGLCRVTPDGPEQTEFCAPEAPEPVGPPVPEGMPEPTPEPPTRPTGTGQIAFDAVSSNFYVAEGTSGGSGVWRMHWDAAGHRIDSAAKIFDSTGVTRIVALALTETRDVVFSDKETAAIRRLDDPAHITTPEASAAIAGFSLAKGALSLAVLGQDIYLADEGLVTKIDHADISGNAVAVAGQPALDAGVSALAADTDRRVVFAGTSTPKLTDAVLSIKDDALSVAAYDRGYANITGMGVGPGGALYVAHDPNSALSPGVDTSGQATLYVKARGPLVAPDAKLVTKPDAAQQSGLPAFTFEALNGSADTHFECTLDDSPVACATTGPARGAYTQPLGDELGEGTHTFTVRAANVPEADATDWGPLATYAFRVDRTAPVVTIDEPSSHTAAGGSVRLYFSADGNGVTYTCRVDRGPARACSPPRDFGDLEPGEHTITVVGTDDALNPSDPLTWSVTATAAPAPASPGAAPTGTTATAGAAAAATTPAPVATPAQARVPRIEIGVPCVEVSPARAAASLRLSGRNAVVRFRAPDRARYAKFTLRRPRGARGARLVETLAYARVVRAGAAHTTRIALTRSQRRNVAGGRTRLAIAYGTCRTRVGDWQWVATANATREGNR
jgi:hypothetical protein